MENYRSLFSKIIKAKTGADVQQILTDLGDSAADVVPNEEFGDGWFWVPLGDRVTNVATIELATHPVRCLVERVNNGIDALIEARLRLEEHPFEPQSPLEAAKACFNRPSQPEKLIRWFDELEPEVEAGRLSVLLLDGASREQPRVDVIDAGLGILPQEFSNTILSLNRGNKMKRHYSLGVWGQGGSASCAFASQVLYASRSVEELGKVGFTLVRRCQIAGWRECCYVALLRKRPSGEFEAANFEINPSSPLEIYEPTGVKSLDSKLPVLAHGTLVRHFDYKIPNAANELSTSARNLYHSMQYLLPDPLISYRLTDCREGTRDHRHMAGSKARLLKLSLETGKRNKSGGIEIKHCFGPAFMTPPGSDEPSIEVRWWALYSWRKSREAIELRSGAEQFTDRDHPIQFLYYGQSHGELTTDPFKKLGLHLLRRHIVVHVDVSRVDANTKRELFVTTRENLRKSAVLDHIVERLTQMMAEDPRLFELERELQDRALASTSESTSREVKDSIIRMLQESGVSVSTQKRRRPRWAGSGAHGNGGAREKLMPIPTLLFPEVTYLKITSPKSSPTEAHLCESKTIRIETDASNSFDDFGMLKVECDSPKMELTHRVPLRDGRASWTFYPTETARAGEKGKISVVLYVPMPDAPVEKFRQTIEFEFQPARGGVDDVVDVPDLEVLPINPADERCHELWRALWPDIEPSDANATSVAFKLLKNGKMQVYYNTQFEPYRNLLKKWTAKSAEFGKLFDDEYKIFSAFHGVMQGTQNRDDAIPPELIEKLLDQERAVAGALIAQHADVVTAMRQKVGGASQTREEPH